MFDFSNEETAHDRAVSCFSTAMENPHVRTIFPHKITTPLSSLLTRYSKIVTDFYHGDFTKYLSVNWLIQHGIDITVFNADNFYPTLTKAIIQYATVNADKGKQSILDFTFNEHTFSSPMILYMNKLIQDDSGIELYHTIVLTYKAELEAIKKRHGGNPIASCVKMTQWYRNVAPSLAIVSRGTFPISPLATESTFLAHVLNYMTIHGLMYPNSPIMIQWKEYITSTYHITWEGESTQTGKVDYDYKHKEGYESPKGILQGGYKL